VQSSEFRDHLECRVQNLEFRVWSLEFRVIVWKLEFGI